MTEKKSTGIIKILGALDKNGSPPPIFETSEGRDFMQVTIKMHEGFDLDHFAAKSSTDNTDGVKANGMKDGMKDSMKDGVNENQDKIIRLIVENNKITIPQMSQLSGLNIRTVQREIKALIDKNIVTRKDGRKIGTWEVIEDLRTDSGVTTP